MLVRVFAVSALVIYSAVDVPRLTPRADHRALVSVGPAGGTVGDLADSWLARLAREDSPSLDDAASFARVHLSWARERPATEISRAEIQAYLDARRIDGYGPDRIRGLAYWWAGVLREGGIDLNVSALRLPRRQRIKPSRSNIPTVAEVCQIIRCPQLRRHQRAWVAGLLLTGCRTSEGRGARLGDVDRGADGLWVWRCSEQLHAKRRSWRPTKDKATHEFPIHLELQAILEDLHPRWSDPDAPLFPSYRGGHWSPTPAINAWNEALDLAGVGRRTPHVARHTFITLLIEAGANPLAVRSITHPGSLPHVDGAERADKGAFPLYVHSTTAARIAAVRCLRLGPTEVDLSGQLELRFT